MNPDQFFRDVTLRVCSSLDLQTSLRRALPLLAEAFPIDDVFVDVLDYDLGALRRVAHVNARETTGATHSPSSAPAPLIPLPERLWKWVEKMARLTQPKDIHWVEGSKEESEALCAQMVAGGKPFGKSPIEL